VRVVVKPPAQRRRDGAQLAAALTGRETPPAGEGGVRALNGGGSSRRSRD